MLGWIPTTVEEYRSLCDGTRDSRRDRASDLLGTIGEEICEAIMAESHFYIVPLSKASDGGAPIMLGKDKLILPDFDLKCPQFKYSAFIDAKAKAGPVLKWKQPQEYRQGINRRNFEHYIRCQEVANQPSGLFILECFDDADSRANWTGAILVQSLKALGQPCETLREETPPKVYWPRKRFKEIGRFSPREWELMARGSWAPNMEDHLHGVFNRREQAVLFA